MKQLSVNNIYKYSKTQEVPLLGTNNYDFWVPYTAAFSVFDRYFRDRFKSWLYWPEFDDDESTDDIYDDFVESIQAHLTINSKRYSELYKVHTLAADAYDIVNNYDLTETHTATRSDSATNISGSRSDSMSGSDTIGGHTDSRSASNVSGSRTDTESGSATDGARQDSTSVAAGAQTTTTENQIEGFNSSAYQDADKTTLTAGAHTDTTNISKGAQTNNSSNTLNKGEQTDTIDDSTTYGAHTDSHTESSTKGQQTDTHTGSGSENVNIRRYGNIGIQTAADIIGGHIKLWDAFNFYGLIFDEIAKEFLLLD